MNEEQVTKLLEAVETRIKASMDSVGFEDLKKRLEAIEQKFAEAEKTAEKADEKSAEKPEDSEKEEEKKKELDLETVAEALAKSMEKITELEEKLDKPVRKSLGGQEIVKTTSLPKDDKEFLDSVIRRAALGEQVVLGRSE